jgi:hypothetical protein
MTETLNDREALKLAIDEARRLKMQRELAEKHEPCLTKQQRQRLEAKEIVRQFVWNDVSPETIAELTGRPLGDIHTILRRRGVLSYPRSVKIQRRTRQSRRSGHCQYLLTVPARMAISLPAEARYRPEMTRQGILFRRIEEA